jgi:LysR family transcriptional regulator, pca operon transcriptional activator
MVRPKQRHIDCFIEVVRQGSVAAASEALALSQPAVSRTLADLEAILGARLMERTRSGITLTEAGEMFLRYASASASALEQGVVQIARIRRDARQAVNVGVLPNVAARVLPVAVEDFKSVQADVPVRIFTGTNRNLTQSLREGDLDFVVGRLAAPEDMAGLVFEPLYQEDLVAVAAPDHHLLDATSSAEIGSAVGRHTVLLPSSGTIIREAAEQLLLSIGAGEIADVIETTSVEFGRAYVQSTEAIWITPRGTVSRDIAAGRLRLLPIDTAATRGAVGITARQGMRLSPLASHLATLIQRIARDI